jgi:hypothetical protein
LQTTSILHPGIAQSLTSPKISLNATHADGLGCHGYVRFPHAACPGRKHVDQLVHAVGVVRRIPISAEEFDTVLSVPLDLKPAKYSFAFLQVLAS